MTWLRGSFLSFSLVLPLYRSCSLSSLPFSGSRMAACLGTQSFPPSHQPIKQSPGRRARAAGDEDVRSGRKKQPHRHAFAPEPHSKRDRAAPPLPSLPTLPFSSLQAHPSRYNRRPRQERACTESPPSSFPALPSLRSSSGAPPSLLRLPFSLVDFTESARLGPVQPISPLPRPPSSFLLTPPISSPVEDGVVAVAPAPTAAPAVAAVGVAGTGVVKRRRR